MRTCQSCGRENPPDRDFCECGEYLRWEPTNYQMPAVTPPAEQPPPPEPPPAQQPPTEPPPAEQPPGEPAPPAIPEPGFVTRAQPAVPKRAAPPPPPSQPTPAPAPPPPPEPAPPPPRPEPPPPRAGAAITLRLPQDQPSAGAGSLGVAVVPGERARVLALVRNQSEIVDNYELVVHGLPPEWWTVTPDTVYLVPFGSAGAYEQEIEIVLHPPRSPEAEARRWELQAGVYSRAREGEVAAAPFTLGILPFEDYSIRVRPERASGRLGAKYDVRVANNANAVVLLALDAADGDGECSFRFDSQAIEVPTGSARSVRLRVRPPGQIWLGRPLERRFEIVAASGEAGEQLLAAKLEDDGVDGGARGKLGRLGKTAGVTPPKVSAPKLSVGPGGIGAKAPQVRGPSVRAPQAKAINLVRPTLGLRALKQSDRGAAVAAPPPPLQPKQAIFRQKAWLPWWLSIVVPLLALLALMLFLLLPKSVEVPDVVGSEGVFAAQQKLIEAGLVLGGREQTPSTKAKPGTVLKQSPAAGADAKKGAAVSIEIAVSNGETTVPALAGATLAEADKRLRAKGLTKGAVSVIPPDLKAKIASTLPEAGERVKVGSAVDIFYGTDKPGDKPGGGSAGGSGGGKPGGTPGAQAGDIAVPELKPPDVQGYGGALTKAGLVPGKTEKQISDAGPGLVFGTDPPVGTKVAKGTKVKLLVSAGFPPMAFDTGDNVVLANAGTGKRITPAIAKSAALEKDPTWSADGARVAYTADERLVMADPDKRDRPPIALRPKAERYADPSFAPTTRTSVLAVARINGDDRQNTDLCVGKVTIDDYKPQCMEDDRFAVRLAHWSRNGKTILVSASSSKGDGIVRYQSDVPFSTKKSDWGKGEFVTPRSPEGGVLEVAISPDGKQLAAIADIESTAPLLYLGKPGDLKLEEATKLEVQACKVAWLDNRWLAAVKLGANCDQDTGEIVRLSVDAPTETNTITAKGDNPTFKPLTAGG